MDLHLSGKRVAVFGGSRGIGLATARAFAAEDAHVALCARGEAGVSQAVEELSSGGASVEGRALDVRDGAAVHSWIDHLGRDGGVSAAVICASAFAMEASEEAWRQALEVDLLGSVRIIEELAPVLAQSAELHGDASIVYISTTAAREAVFTAAYGPVKAAMAHFCKSRARDLAGRRVRVNTVSPGTVYFEGGPWHKIKAEAPQRFHAALARNPTGRMATAEEVADAAVFLSGPRSSFTTGANLSVDGALTLAVQF